MHMQQQLSVTFIVTLLYLTQVTRSLFLYMNSSKQHQVKQTKKSRYLRTSCIMQGEKQKTSTTCTYKGEQRHFESSSIKYRGIFFFLGPARCSVARTAAHASQRELLLGVSLQMYRKQKLDVQADFHIQRPPCCVSFGKATTCTDLLCMSVQCNLQRLFLSHIKVTIIGQRKEEDTWKVQNNSVRSLYFTWMSRSGTKRDEKSVFEIIPLIRNKETGEEL